MNKKSLVRYRAVHERTAWRAVYNHHSLQNALSGLENGAPGLFAGRTRIDHAAHGPALFVVIWRVDGDVGYILKRNSDDLDKPHKVVVPIEVVEEFEAYRGVSLLVLESFFPATPRYGSPGGLVSGLEGAISLRRHMRRERRPSLVAAKKAATIHATGRLACEACAFEFSERYGDLAAHMCEVHHSEPIGERKGPVETTLDDLAILCANCHRFIHTTRPMWSVSQLADHIKQQGKNGTSL